MCTIYKLLKYEFLERIWTIHTEKPTHSASHGLARAVLCALVLMCGTAAALREQEGKRRLGFEPAMSFEELKEKGFVER